MCPNTIELNGITYVAASSDEGKKILGEIRIVVLQRGWVLIGRYKPVEGTTTVQLHDSCVIRRWGTTKGLGELAKNGVTSNTILDKNYGVVEFDVLTQVLSIVVDESKWKEL